jgi:hypothetical protein
LKNIVIKILPLILKTPIWTENLYNTIKNASKSAAFLRL